MPIEFPSTLAVMKVLLIVSIGVGVSGALLAWRERPEPGAIPLAAMLTGQAWWSATLFFQITASGLATKVLWINVSWIGIAVIPVAWLFFSLEYSGYTSYVRPRYIALVSIIPVVTMVLGVTDPFHDLIYVSSTLVETGGSPMLERTPGVWFWVIAAYTYLLGLMGAIPLLQFVTSTVSTFRGQTLTILIGLVTPWVTNALFLMGMLPTGGVDPTPVAFTVSGVAYLGALTRFQLFGTSPTPIRQARRQVFGQMQEGAIVLDRHNHVVDMNERAAVAIQQAPGAVLGRPLESVLPSLGAIVTDDSEPGREVYTPEEGDSAYDISVNQLTDIHQRVTGKIITLHDISTHLRQQQRLKVLHRVFRHNIRSNVQLISGYAESLADQDSEDKAATIRQSAMEIEALGKDIRTVLDVFDEQRDPSQPVELTPLVRECVNSVREAYPDVTIECDIDHGGVYVNSTLQEILENALENAAKHNTEPDPHVRVAVETDNEHVELVIEDNGPGIDDDELAIVEDRTETPLRHGSGLGLPLIVWGTEIIGGRVTFEDNDPTGLIVRIEVPNRTPTEDEDPSGEPTTQTWQEPAAQTQGREYTQQRSQGATGAPTGQDGR